MDASPRASTAYLHCESMRTGGAVIPRRRAISACSEWSAWADSTDSQNRAAAVIFAHNHPSGVAEPSRADVQITDKLKMALDLVDVRVLDHIVVTGDACISMANRGLI